MAENRTKEEDPRLTALEDAELRQLTWFGLAGDLSETSRDRITELRARDRREGVRDPRPDPLSQDSDGRRYITESEPNPDTDTSETDISCSNCGFGPVITGSICPHCAVRTYPSH